MNARYNSSAPSYNENKTALPLELDAAGNLKVVPLSVDTLLGRVKITDGVNVLAITAAGLIVVDPSGGAVRGFDGASNQPIKTLTDGSLVSIPRPTTSGGLQTFMASGSDGSSILTNAAQAIKAAAGQVYGYYIYNPEGAVTFVHFYDVAAAGVAVGTTPPKFTLAIPAGSAANLITEIGLEFTTAMSISATTTVGGNGAPATGVSAVVWFK